MRVRLLAKVVALVVVVPALGASVQAQDLEVRPTGNVKVITISGGKINPTRLEINRGDTVVWTTLDQSATISFPEGSEVRLACVAPTRFRMNKDGFYTSGILPIGGTASLCFIEPGTYNYIVFVRGGEGDLFGPRVGIPIGTIVVREGR